jgi:hypothetical protein
LEHIIEVFKEEKTVKLFDDDCDLKIRREEKRRISDANPLNPAEANNPW